MKTYIIISSILSIVVVGGTILLSAARQARFVRVGADSIITFWFLAAIFWLNSLTAWVLAWHEQSYPHSQLIILTHVLWGPIGIWLLHWIAPITGELTRKVTRYFDGTIGARKLKSAIIQLQKARVRRLLKSGFPYPLNKARKHKAIHDVFEDWLYPNVGIVREILDAGSEYGATMLCSAVADYKQGDVIAYLLDNNLDINATRCRYGYGHRNAPVVARAHDPDTFRLLIDYGADLNETDEHGVQALSLLIFNVKDKDNNSKNYANNISEVDLVNALSNVKTAFNARHEDTGKNTALLYAVGEEMCQLAQVLINIGADVNHVNAKGKTALAYAKSPEMSKLLVEHGAKS